MPSEEVLSSLNKSVSIHLEATYHYLLAACQFAREYPKLSEKLKAYSDDERRHLTILCDRLNALNTRPTSDHEPPAQWEPLDYEAFLAASLDLARRARQVEVEGIATCRDDGDETSALIFADLLTGSEEFIRGVQATMTNIDQVGLDNLLSTFL